MREDFMKQQRETGSSAY